MPTFALKEIKAVKGKQTFYKLVKDNKCHFDIFEEKMLKTQFAGEVGKIYAYMERIADGESMPADKFKDITPSNESVKEYEIKTKNLRVYLTKTEDGKIVIIGGKKNTQKSDLRKFRSLKKQYIQSTTK